MENLIQELLEIDRQAREAVQAAQEDRTRENAQLESRKKELRERYLRRAQQKIEIARRQAAQQSERERIAAEEKYRRLTRELEQSFTIHADEWVGEIVARCVAP